MEYNKAKMEKRIKSRKKVILAILVVFFALLVSIVCITSINEWTNTSLILTVCVICATIANGVGLFVVRSLNMRDYKNEKHFYLDILSKTGENPTGLTLTDGQNEIMNKYFFHRININCNKPMNIILHNFNKDNAFSDVAIGIFIENNKSFQNLTVRDVRGLMLYNLTIFVSMNVIKMIFLMDGGVTVEAAYSLIYKNLVIYKQFNNNLYIETIEDEIRSINEELSEMITDAIEQPMEELEKATEIAESLIINDITIDADTEMVDVVEDFDEIEDSVEKPENKMIMDISERSKEKVKNVYYVNGLGTMTVRVKLGQTIFFDVNTLDYYFKNEDGSTVSVECEELTELHSMLNTAFGDGTSYFYDDCSDAKQKIDTHELPEVSYTKKKFEKDCQNTKNKVNIELV